jgi:hypothetical protein
LRIPPAAVHASLHIDKIPAQGKQKKRAKLSLGWIRLPNEVPFQNDLQKELLSQVPGLVRLVALASQVRVNGFPVTPDDRIDYFPVAIIEP